MTNIILAVKVLYIALSFTTLENINNLDDIRDQQVAHAVFVPCWGNYCLLGRKGDKLAFIGGGCKRGKHEKALACLTRELREEITPEAELSDTTDFTISWFLDSNSIIVWYKLASYEEFDKFAVRPARGHHGSELSSLTVISWQELLEPDLLSQLDGQPQWQTTTIAKVLLFSNLRFFYDVQTLEQLLSYDYINVPVFSPICQPALFTTLNKEEFLNTRLLHILLVPYVKASGGGGGGGTSIVASTGTGISNDTNSDGNSIWLKMQENGNYNFLHKDCQYDRVMTTRECLNSLLRPPYDKGYGQTRESTIEAIYDKCTFMTYLATTDLIGIVWYAVPNDFHRGRMDKLLWSDIMTPSDRRRIRLAESADRILFSYRDFCCNWNRTSNREVKHSWSSLPPVVYPCNDPNNCFVDDYVYFNDIINRFHQQHQQFISDLLYKRVSELDDDYVNNFFAFDVEPYLSRRHPLLVIYDEWLAARGIGDQLTATGGGSRRRRLPYTQLLEERARQSGELSQLDHPDHPDQPAQTTDINSTTAKIVEWCSQADIYIDTDLYYNILSVLYATAVADGTTLTELSQAYFSHHVY